MRANRFNCALCGGSRAQLQSVSLQYAENLAPCERYVDCYSYWVQGRVLSFFQHFFAVDLGRRFHPRHLRALRICELCDQLCLYSFQYRAVFALPGTGQQYLLLHEIICDRQIADLFSVVGGACVGESVC